VTWDSRGLRIEATNSSLQQILSEVATETGAKVEGMGADQRVYGAYGPGQARDVLMQLLQGSGYNVLMAGDLGAGAPRQIVLSMRRSGTNAPGAANRPAQEAADEDVPDEVEDQPPPQPQPTPGRPGIGPGGPVRTPQQVMEEMQQRQQQQQQQPPQPNPQNPQQNWCFLGESTGNVRLGNRDKLRSKISNSSRASFGSKLWPDLDRGCNGPRAKNRKAGAEDAICGKDAECHGTDCCTNQHRQIQ
jgi:hypothetical protein